VNAAAFPAAGWEVKDGALVANGTPGVDAGVGRVVSRRNAVQHWLNGALVLEYDRTSPGFLERVAPSKFRDIDGFGRHATGRILLQDHGSTVRFRNLRIRDLAGR
jgi:hypothetical protein